jgi:outer membrane beta-barrel protein
MEQSMNRQSALLASVTLGATVLHMSPAAAAAGPNPQEIQLYGGEIFGDRLTQRSISGSTPRLNDSATFGGRYTVNYTDMWGLQLSAGYSPGRAGHVRSGDSSLGVTTVDLDGVWNFTPGYKIVGYAVAGVGYAWADLDRVILGSAGGTPATATTTDSNGYTANAGLGAKYYLTDNLFVDLDSRYRYFSKLVSNYGQGVNTVETTLGVGWLF